MACYRITNFGNTRKFPHKNEYYEIPRNGYIDVQDKSVADALGKNQFIKVEDMEQPKQKENVVKVVKGKQNKKLRSTKK